MESSAISQSLSVVKNDGGASTEFSSASVDDRNEVITGEIAALRREANVPSGASEVHVARQVLATAVPGYHEAVAAMFDTPNIQSSMRRIAVRQERYTEAPRVQIACAVVVARQCEVTTAMDLQARATQESQTIVDRWKKIAAAAPPSVVKYIRQTWQCTPSKVLELALGLLVDRERYQQSLAMLCGRVPQAYMRTIDSFVEQCLSPEDAKTDCIVQLLLGM